MVKLTAILLTLAITPAMAQPTLSQRPTAIQIMANQLATAIMNNAELVERNGQLEEQVAALRKKLAEKQKPSEPSKTGE